MNIIELRDVDKSFSNTTLFRGATLAIERGRTHALVGPNGSGKSVLFRIICGFITPDAGSVWIDPEFLSAKRVFPEKFGILIDRPGFVSGRSGIDNLRELAAIRGAIGDSEIRDAMRRVDLDPTLNQKVRNYSLGMRQKLGLAQAIMENPEVLLLDEPFNALDADSVVRVRELLRGLRAEGKTVVFTSHHADDVTELSEATFRVERHQIHAI